MLLRRQLGPSFSLSLLSSERKISNFHSISEAFSFSRLRSRDFLNFLTERVTGAQLGNPTYQKFHSSEPKPDPTKKFSLNQSLATGSAN